MKGSMTETRSKPPVPKVTDPVPKPFKSCKNIIHWNAFNQMRSSPTKPQVSNFSFFNQTSSSSIPPPPNYTFFKSKVINNSSSSKPQVINYSCFKTVLLQPWSREDLPLDLLQ